MLVIAGIVFYCGAIVGNLGGIVIMGNPVNYKRRQALAIKQIGPIETISTSGWASEVRFTSPLHKHWHDHMDVVLFI